MGADPSGSPEEPKLSQMTGFDWATILGKIVGSRAEACLSASSPGTSLRKSNERLADPATGLDYIVKVENRGLAGGYGALRRIETDTSAGAG